MVLARFDTEANALYVRFEKRKSKIKKTIPLGEGAYLDVTENNKPVGIELILPKSMTQATKILCKLPTAK